MTEAELQTNVRHAAKVGGWLAYHTNDSRRSDKGFPDLVLVHPLLGRLLFVELKSEKGKLRPEQQHWVRALDFANQDVYVWRPEHWLNGSVQRVLIHHLEVAA